MKTLLKFSLPALVIAFAFGSCKKNVDTGILNAGNFTDTSSSTLKDAATAAGFPFGFAIENALYTNNAPYKAIVNREVASVTFGNELKYGSVVQSDGSFNFATADALVASTTAAGLKVYGHVLGWHSQQNGTFLKNYAGIVTAAATELSTNGSFENGLTGWSTFNTNGATISADNVAADAHTGSGSMKVVNTTPHPGAQYQVQVSSTAFTTVPGTTYTITYWVRAATAGGSIRLSTGPTAAQYQGDQTIGTAWQQVTWNITASLSSTTFLFDMGLLANTYYIDDVSVKQVVVAASQTQVAAKLDTALNKWVTAAVSRYVGKIYAWDAVNELFADDGNIRNNSNTSTTDNNVIVWSNYLGRDYALKVFNYAKAADPNAVLFINDYNLESSSQKLDSLIAYVKEITARGAKVDGIGTQMHISWLTSYAGIDAMFQKLAATGLKVRISELDVKINPSSKIGFTLTPLMATYQADMYHYVVQSYLKYVPIAQRFGITVWGVDDATSWLYKSGTDFTDLYNPDYSKKAAYAAVLQALKGQ